MSGWAEWKPKHAGCHKASHDSTVGAYSRLPIPNVQATGKRGAGVGMESAIPVAAQAVAAVGEQDEIPERTPPSSRVSNRHEVLEAIWRPEKQRPLLRQEPAQLGAHRCLPGRGRQSATVNQPRPDDAGRGAYSRWRTTR